MYSEEDYSSGGNGKAPFSSAFGATANALANYFLCVTVSRSDTVT
jgi:hypothetical protein